MKSRSKNNNILNPILIMLLICFGPESISAQEVEEEGEFEYSEKSEKGPRNWGKLKKEWIACSNGDMQSPINLSNHKLIIISKKELKIKYTPSMLLSTTEAMTYKYDMELHLVHLSTNPNLENKIAVVGVLYNIGKPDKFLSKLARDISSMIDKKGEEKRVGIIDPADIKRHSKRYYRYMGSLTTPPCTQGVIWTINKPFPGEESFVKLLREAVHDYAEQNARPLQKEVRNEIPPSKMKYILRICPISSVFK